MDAYYKNFIKQIQTVLNKYGNGADVFNCIEFNCILYRILEIMLNFCFVEQIIVYPISLSINLYVYIQGKQINCATILTSETIGCRENFIEDFLQCVL